MYVNYPVLHWRLCPHPCRCRKKIHSPYIEVLRKRSPCSLVDHQGNFEILHSIHIALNSGLLFKNISSTHEPCSMHSSTPFKVPLIDIPGIEENIDSAMQQKATQVWSLCSRCRSHLLAELADHLLCVLALLRGLVEDLLNKCMVTHPIVFILPHFQDCAAPFVGVPNPCRFRNCKVNFFVVDLGHRMVPTVLPFEGGRQTVGLRVEMSAKKLFKLLFFYDFFMSFLWFAFMNEKNVLFHLWLVILFS